MTQSAYIKDMEPGPEHSIGIFDSGIGGLTVVRQMVEKLPNESLIYFGDTARVPYGTKSDRAVREFAWEDSLFLLGHGVKMIVVACNTASAVALGELNHFLRIPVIGVIEPGAKAATNITKNKRVGVIGTQATIDSKAYEKEIHRIDPEIEVITASCPLFVPLAEEGWLATSITKQVARTYLNKFKKKNIDTLILGCTHYPLLKKVIKEAVGKNITLVDSATETARKVGDLLGGSLKSAKKISGEHKFFVSDEPASFIKVGQRFLGRKIKFVKKV